ncbi:MAG: hypothetical protein JNL58_04725 [Planctomyces sp.]|nr:hypothetical protein [Planctomyces sp.]
MPVFSISAELNCSPSSLRAFVGRPLNLPRISDPDMKLEILRAPEFVTVGEEIEFRIMAYGFKQRATHIYTAADDMLIEERQLEGPLRQWKHRQEFQSTASGLTLLTDIIEFEPPGGMLGFMMTENRITESLDEGFTTRYDLMKELIHKGVIQ